jgi:hypothetical protein
MATLTASHYLYLTREQRYGLHKGQKIKTNGILIPVWFERGNTSEPAPEVFCKYTLRNERRHAGVELMDDGSFEIDLPYFDIVGKEPVEKELLRAAQKRIGTSEQLLDLDEGGAECLEFRFYKKMSHGGKEYHLVNFVEIKPVELLVDTLS